MYTGTLDITKDTMVELFKLTDRGNWTEKGSGTPDIPTGVHLPVVDRMFCYKAMPVSIR